MALIIINPPSLNQELCLGQSFESVDIAEQGKSIADAVRTIGTTEVTYYRWRKEYRGLKSDLVRKLKRSAAS